MLKRRMNFSANPIVSNKVQGCRLTAAGPQLPLTFPGRSDRGTGMDNHFCSGSYSEIAFD